MFVQFKHNIIKKLSNIINLLFVSLLLLAHVNFIFSDYTSLIEEDNIELSEQEENEQEDKLKKKNNKEQYFNTLFNLHFLDRIVTVFDKHLSYTLTERFLTIFSPPPESF